MTDRRTVKDMSKEEILRRLLQKQIGYYEVVLDLTRQEGVALEKNKGLSGLAPLMKKKQILLGCIEEIDHALRPVKERWRESKDRGTALAQQVQECLSTLDGILKMTLEIDAKNQRLFQSQLDALKKSLPKTQV